MKKSKVDFRLLPLIIILLTETFEDITSLIFLKLFQVDIKVVEIINNIEHYVFISPLKLDIDTCRRKHLKYIYSPF